MSDENEKPKGKNTEQVYVTEETHKKIRLYAAEHDLRLGDVVEKAMANINNTEQVLVDAKLLEKIKLYSQDHGIMSIGSVVELAMETLLDWENPGRENK